MGPAYFVIAILGCADGGTACTPVATLQTHYATGAALETNSDFDFPTLLAQCRAGATSASAQAEHDKPLPASASRG
jgi:hypothetical protein